MSSTALWLSELAELGDSDAFLSSLRRLTPLPGESVDPQELLRDLLVPIEWYILSTKRWSDFLVEGGKRDEFLASPRTAIVHSIDEISSLRAVPSELAAVLAEAYLKRGQMEASELCAGTAFVLGDRSPAVLGLLVGKALREQRVEEARELVEIATRLHPGGPETLYGEARLALATGEWEQAVTLMETLTREFPGYRPAWEVLVETHLLNQHWAQAAQTALSAAEKMPLHPGFLRQANRAFEGWGRPRDALDCLVRLEEILRSRSDCDRRQRTQLSLEIARKERALGRHESAMHRYQSLLQNGERAPGLFTDMAECLQETGNSSEAAAVLRRALQVTSGHIDVRRSLGKFLFDAHQDQEAFELLQSAAEDDPTKTDCLLLMAYLCLRNRMFPEAVELATAVAQADATRAVEALVVVGDASRFQGLAAAAASAYEAALELSPDNDEIRRRIQELEKTDSPPKASSRRADT